MPPVKYAEGTKSPGTPSEYTDAQWKALERVKQTTPRLKYGAARAEFVNKVMLPDGTISDDLEAIRVATMKHDDDDLKRLDSFTAEHRDDILRGRLTPGLRAQLTDLQYWANHSQVGELEDHIAQQRFLLIVDANNVVRIWFQCVTPDNPDIDFLNPDEDPDAARRQAARDSFEAARVARGG